jgi:ParB-like chromosome segregation protein Spo0J
MSKIASPPRDKRINARIVEHLSIAQLKPYREHARAHSKKQIEKIARSVKRFGFVAPILIDENSVILAGHALVEAAKLLDMTEVPVLRVEHLSDTEKRALRLALNRLAEDAAWDRERLSSELQFLVDANFEIEATGFEIATVDLLLGERGLAVGEEEGPEDDIPEVAKHTSAITQAGDIWTLNRHRLLCADARAESAYQTLLGDELAVTAFTDPPYNVRVAHIGGRGRIKHAEFAMATGEMTRPQYTRFLTGCFNLMAKHSINGAVHFICTDAKHLPEMTSATDEAYDEHLTVAVWNKMTGGMGGLYRNQHELVFVEKVGTAPIINNVRLGRDGRNRTTVWTYRGLASFGKERLSDLAMHPTVKPMAMVADAILDVSRRNDVVLDPFGGSGTTIIAAEKTGRRARVLEIDRHYCDVIVRRWQTYSGKPARLGEDGQTFEEVERRRSAEQ